MISDKPKDPEIIKAINACLEDLHLLAKKMKKEKAISIYIGCVKDNINSLELVRDYGSFGGKCPWPINEPSLSVFKQHGLEGLIHPPWTPKHRKTMD